VAKVIWLKSGIEGDDTDGHIDNLARFVNVNTLLCAFEADVKDPNHEPLKKNFEILRRAKDQDGKQLNIVKVPMPPPRRDFIRGATRRLAASYLNFYIANGVVLVPTFNADRDAVALEIIRQVFPGRRVVGIDCSDLIYGAGTLHCISQQQPAGR
jgi:agmatine deiminase